MKKVVNKDKNQGKSLKSGKKEKVKGKKVESPMEEDAGNQDGSAGLGGTSAI